ncbi:MAG: hypothetical protein ABFS56_11000 [Pseudomonadota bacterium]
MSTQKKLSVKKDSAGTGQRRSRRSYLQLKLNISETTPTGVVILDALLSDDPKFFKRYGLGPKVTRANKLLWLAYLGITQGHAPGSERVTEYSPNESIPPKLEVAEPVTEYSPNESLPPKLGVAQPVTEYSPNESIPPKLEVAQPVTEYSPNESLPPKLEVAQPVTEYSPNESLPPKLEDAQLPKLELQMTKADESEQEEDALDEGALMAGLI